MKNEHRRISGNPALGSDRPKEARLSRYFDVPKVIFNAPGSFGNAPRNFLRGPGSFNIDAAMQKSFPIHENIRVMLRGEFFNLLNHGNFGLPGSNVSSPNTLGIINTAADPRILQLGAKLSF